MGLLLLNGESGLNPRTLFANGEQGLWLDPSQLSTLYQDSNGVTPCTAAGDPVGLILDQSRGGLSQIGADLVTNGGFAADTDWTKGANWTIGSGVATKTGGAANNLTQTIGSTAAAWYRISLDVTRSAGTLTVSLGTSGTTYAITATGSYTFFILAGSGTQTLTLAGDSSFAGTVDNVVVKNVPGNHASQSSSSARPTLARIPSSGRRNLLVRSEEFDNASWVKQESSISQNTAVAPDGTTTADTLIASTNSSNVHRLSQTVTTTSGVSHTFSIYAKSDGTYKSLRLTIDSPLTAANYDLENGVCDAGLITSVGNGWYRCSLTFTSNTTSTVVRPWVFDTYANAQSVTAFTGTGTNGIFIWGAQLETGSTVSNYQKVVATTDVTESGVSDLYHLVFDGSDDSLVTNSVDFSGTDEMTVIAGVRKLSDAAIGLIAGFVANTELGRFNLLGPDGPLTNLFGYNSKGTTNRKAAATAAGYAAPLSCVVTGASDISADSVLMRINGTQVDSNSSDQGAGNYESSIIYIGRQAASIYPFNGHIYQLIIRGKTTPTGKLLEAERFTAKKTGVTNI